MLRGLDGDARAHRDLLVALGVRLRAYLGQRMSDSPADVEDLVQDCLLSVHTRRASYDRDQPLTAWAHAIARYKLIDYWRRRKVRFAKPLDDVSEFLAAPAAFRQWMPYLLMVATLFVGGIGRTDFPGGSHQQLIDSILGRLMILPEDTIVWPGHGYGGSRSTLGEEKRDNPYIS